MINLYIKNIFLLLILLVSSCSDTEKEATKKYGKVDLSISKASEVEITTKSNTVEADGNYSIEINNSTGSSYVKGKYEDVTAPFDLPIGDYSITTESCTQLEAIKDKGVQRFATNKNFNVLTDQTTTLNLICSMVNSRVSLGVTDEFKAIFTDVELTINENSNSDRKFVFDKSVVVGDNTKWVYFNIDETPIVILTVKATRNDGVVKTYTKDISIKAKTWHKVTMTSSASSNGQVDIVINVNETIIEVIKDSVIDPYE